MQLVHGIEQIKLNIAELERGRGSTGAVLEEYRLLIQRGTCFMLYRSAKGVAFTPSRFIGYVGSTLVSHRENAMRDGRVTNKAINTILGQNPTPNALLDKYYREFCVANGIAPSKKGTFGVERKYWLSPDFADLKTLLEDMAMRDVQTTADIAETQREQVVLARIGQGNFRAGLINLWQGCSVSCCDFIPALRASHIKPWSVSSNDERLDVYNGLLLTPNLDILFDKGLISFKDDGGILISPRLPETARIALGCDESMGIKPKAENIPYLAWHRDNLFICRDESL